MSHSDESLEFPPGFLTQVARDRRVSEGELKALTIALNRNGSQDVARELGITKAAARKRLGEVYRKFEISGRGPGKLASLRLLLQSQANQSQANQSQASQLQVSQSQADLLELEIGLPSVNQPSLNSAGTNPDSAHLALYEKSALGRLVSEPASEPVAAHWHDASGLDACYGRCSDLERLEAWIGDGSGKKLLAICGIGGIGKTTLAALLMRRVMPRFERHVWIPVDGKPPKVLLREMITHLEATDERGETDARHPVGASSSEHLPIEHLPIENLIERFVHTLEQHRCLVVLDGFESVFNSDSEQSLPSETRQKLLSTFNVRRHQQASAYKPGFSDYTALLRAIQVQPYQSEVMRAEKLDGDRADSAEGADTSCVMLTSREKPREMPETAQDNATQALLHTLSGLKEDEAIALLESFHLEGSSSDRRRLIARYYGHPMALRLASSTIKDAFSGKIRDFLEQDISVFDDLRSVIKPQFKRLSLSEKEVMYWLAINRDPCTIESLQEDIVSEDHTRNVLYTLRSLQRRFLVEVQETRGVASYRMHPIVAGYVLDRFIRSVFRDLLRGSSLSLFNSHALMKADADEELREDQRQRIVKPILERLNNHCKSLYETENLLSDRLNNFRKNNPRRLGYAGGNFVNLLVQLSEGRELREKNFSDLTISQAYLQGVQLKKVNFNSCKLNRSTFTETLSDVMAVAMTASDTALDTVSDVAGVSPSYASALMAAGDANGKIHVWSTQSPAEKRAEWVAHSGWVRAVAFVPDRPWLVTGGDDNCLRLWQMPEAAIQRGTQSLNYPTQIWQKEAWDWVHAVAVSPDGQIIASGGDDKITLYRAADGKEINAFADVDIDISARPIQKNRVRALAFSPDGDWLASCGDDCVVRVWSVAAAQKPGHETEGLLTLRGHSALVHAVCFSADSKLLVSGGADKRLLVWDLMKGEEQERFEHPHDRVRAVAITHDGLLASGGDDCQIRLWNIHSLKHLKDISTQQSRIWSVDFQQRGDKLLLVAGGDKQTLVLWDVTNEKTSVHLRPVRTYRGYTSGIRSVAFLSDQRIMGGGDSGELLVWDREKGDRTATLPLHHGRIWSIAVDREHARIASASDDHTIRLWDAKTGQCLTTLTGHNNWVRSIAFSRHGRLLVSAGDDCSVRIWNTASGFCRKTIDQFDAWVRSVAFNPAHKRYVITGGDDEVVRRWDIKDGHAFTLAKHRHRICSVAYSPDAQLIASGSDDATVIVWDVDKKDKIHHFKNAYLGIKSVAFSPDGRYLAGGGEDQLVYVWDLHSEEPEEHCYELRPKDYQGLSGGIRSVAFSPDSRYIISGGLDEMVRIGCLESIAKGGAQVIAPLIERDRPYENTEIKDVQGLSDLQMANLMTLGAVNRTNSLLS